MARSLAKGKRYRFPLKGQKLDAPQKQGVYVIWTPRGTVDHVGSTYRGKRGLWQRLSNHLHARSSYVIKAHKGNGEKLRGRYQYAFLAIPHPRTRSLVEHAAIGLLCPNHLGSHQSVKKTAIRR